MNNHNNISGQFREAAAVPPETQLKLAVERLPQPDRDRFAEMNRHHDESRRALAEGMIKDRSLRVAQVYADLVAHRTERPTLELKPPGMALSPIQIERQLHREAEWRVFQNETSRLRLVEARHAQSMARFVEAAQERLAARECGQGGAERGRNRPGPTRTDSR